MRSLQLIAFLSLLSSCSNFGTALENASRRVSGVDASTIVLCDRVLNYQTKGSYSLDAAHENRLEELSRRGEDCSQYGHLKRSVPAKQTINVQTDVEVKTARELPPLIPTRPLFKRPQR